MSSLKIPSPWQSDYAIPGYVRAEGLQMRTYTTKWTPRGVYDDPDPYDPSWDKALAIPDYIKSEGYGQGARVTEWAPRGFYVGELGRHQRQLAAGKLPASYQRFGQRAANVMFTALKPVPISHRKQTLRKMMDAIDPTLWQRTSEIAAEEVKKGTPASAALQVGAARAMSAGAAAEVLLAGKSGKVRSDGIVALGALRGTRVRTSLGALPVLTTAIQKLTTQAPVAVESQPQLKVGPFMLPATADTPATFAWSQLSSEQAAELMNGIAKVSATTIAQWVATHQGVATLPSTFVDLSTKFAGGKGKVDGRAMNGTYPIAKFTHPKDQKRYGLFMKVTGTPDAPMIELRYRYDPSILEALWNAIKELAAFWIDVVKTVVDVVGDLACQLASSSGAQIEGAAIGTAAGAGPAVGAAGATSVQQLCQGPPPPPPEETGPGWVLPVAIGGGALLVGYLLTRKRQP